MEIRKGITTKPAVTEIILKNLEKRKELDGILYIGYPILFTAGQSVVIDALWISEKNGIIIFDLIDGFPKSTMDEIITYQNSLFDKIEAMLVGYPHLKKSRKFVGKIDVITFAPLNPSVDFENKIANTQDNLNTIIDSLEDWKESTEELYLAKISIVQSVINLKSAPKRIISKVDSKGSTIKKLENSMSTLDADQEKAVIESYDGIQRIRGLAGSGKTVVLALKAAYLHALHPEWNIAVTFNSRSLKKQFIDLLNIFSIQRTGYAFDQNKVHVIHAWGSSSQGAGIYYNSCLSLNKTFLSVNDAKKYQENTNGSSSDSLLEVVCKKLLNETKDNKPLYDVILVDEAQDLSVSFLKLCFNILDKNKRLVYAYDELQKLDEGSSLPKPLSIFGQEATNDTILQVCYRNSRPILVTAHSLGFGIYRDPKLLLKNEPQLVQFFDEPQLWSELGYKSEGDELIKNNNVVLSRTAKSSPAFLENHASNLIEYKRFNDKEEQAAWVADKIADDIYNEELLHKDILIINPVTYTTADTVSDIRQRLLDKEIRSHIAGKFNPDVFLEENSIAISGIRRAKGNEVPMVYIINSQDCFDGFSLMKLRNILFTAITRSKAWVKIVGIGQNMDFLIEEIEKVHTLDYKLEFKYPTPEEIAKMNIIHREKTETEIEIIHEDLTAIDKILDLAERIKNEDAFIEDYPLKVQEQIKKLIKFD